MIEKQDEGAKDQSGEAAEKEAASDDKNQQIGLRKSSRISKIIGETKTEKEE